MAGYWRIAFVIVLGLTTILWQAGASPAAQAKPEKSTVRIGYGSQSGAFLQLWIAADKGYFIST